MAAPWQPQLDVSGPGIYGAAPQVEFDATGNAVAVWAGSIGETPVIKASSKAAGGSWLPQVSLSDPSSSYSAPRLAVNPAGDAVAVWTHLDGSSSSVQVASRSAGGQWQGPVTISDGGPGGQRHPAVAIDDSGAVVVVWERVNNVNSLVQAATRTAAGAWQQPVDISPAIPFSIFEPTNFAPEVAVDGGGDAVAVWHHYDGTDSRIQAADKTPSGAWQEPLDLGIGFRPLVASDESGGTVAIWTNYGGSDVTTQASSREGEGAWQAPIDISPPGMQAYEPELAINSAGHAVAVWLSFLGGAPWGTQAAERVDGAWSDAVALTPPGEIDSVPDVAIDPDGDVVAAWTMEGNILRAATKTASGAWQAAIDLPGGTANNPGVALNAKGDALVASERTGDSEVIVQVTAHEAGRLDVSKEGSGLGTVSSAPAGLDCGPVCSAQFDDDSTVTLSAAAAPGSEFVGWSGACSGTGPCTVSMTSSKSVTAEFSALPAAPTGAAGDPGAQTPARPDSTPPSCSAVSAEAGTFVPTRKAGRVVPGLRARLKVPTASNLEVSSTLTYGQGGDAHRISLAPLAVHTNGTRNLRLALPASVRASLPLGTWVELSMRISVRPDSLPTCEPTVSTRRIKVKVTQVLAKSQAGVA